MSTRKLNTLEQKIHQAVLAAPNNTLTQKEVESVAPDAQARTASLNFLLGAGLFKLLKDDRGTILFRAVVKKELDAKKDMSGEEGMVLSHVQAAGNQGIWTKHIKAKTELHQTVIDRILKSLVQKQLIKAVKNVQFPTRKIYMLFHLDPSAELTGGPWYTDNELDTEFIKLLSRACLQFVKERSFPRTKHRSEDTTQAPLYAISAAPAYPSSQQVQAFLSKSKITETELSVEHVEMLLNVLVLDGEIERIPAFGAALWDSSTGNDKEGDSESEGVSDDDRRTARKKKKRKTEESTKKRKRRSRLTSESEDASGSESESESEDERSKRKKKSKKGASSKASSSSKKSKGKGRKQDEEDESEESEEDRKRKKKRKVTEDSDDERDSRKKKSRSKSSSKKKKRRDATSSGSDSETMDSDSDSSASDGESDDEDERHSRSRSKSKHSSRAKSKSSKTSSRRRSPSPARGVAFADDGLGEAFGGAAYVYRAVRGGGAPTGHGPAFLGWSSETPCAKCPVFEFCKEGGPVNPTGCVYYGEWLNKGVPAAV